MSYRFYPDIYNRCVAEETRKTFKDKLDSGFFDKYMSGIGIDVGFVGYLNEPILPVLPSATGIDLNTPGYDGRTLPYENGSLDYVYSSHTLEHIDDWKNAIRDWYRVLKVGGHLVITVPHRDLYERKMNLPSKWNQDHKRFYIASSLLSEIEQSLDINSYRIRHFEETDKGYDYAIPLNLHPSGALELLIVLEKINPPEWKVI